ncbi:MAG: hypothetical protein R2811_16245 [Flavobacteriales bacterium]
MNDDRRVQQVEQDNRLLRAAMLRYTDTETSDHRDQLKDLLTTAQLMIPITRGAEGRNRVPEFGTMYNCEKGAELHVFTSVLMIPDSCSAEEVLFCPFRLLNHSLIADGGVGILRLDPGSDHGVGFLFRPGGQQMFALKGDGPAEDGFRTNERSPSA